MKKTIYILGLLFFANTLLGQVGLQLESSSKTVQKEKSITLSPQSNFEFSKNQNNAPVDLKNFILSKNLKNNSSSFSIKNNNTELAFFCKIESEIEQASKIPLKFRLGEVQAVDRKEGKWKQFENQ